MFHLRDYDKSDFEELFRLDQQCFEPGIAFSRPEFSSYIARRHSFTIVADVVEDSTEAADTESLTAGSGQSVSSATSERKPRTIASTRTPIAGFITVEFHRDGYGHVITIDVREQYRRSGLGTLLMEAAEKRVRKLNGFMIVLEVAVNNTAALRFYERHGFKVIKPLPRYYNRTVDGLFLTKRL